MRWGEEVDGIVHGWACECCGAPIPFDDQGSDTAEGAFCQRCRARSAATINAHTKGT